MIVQMCIIQGVLLALLNVFNLIDPVSAECQYLTRVQLTQFSLLRVKVNANAIIHKYKHVFHVK